MTAHVVLRKVHYWASIVVAVPLVIVIGAGVLLMLKKEVAWIQPPEVTGSAPGEVPRATVAEMFEAAKSVPQAGIESWADLDRVDIQPGDGTVKFVSLTRWEVQVDTATAEVLQAAYRRSDLIENIHDGSFFAGDLTKHYLFLPSGIVLFLMWATGLYMFFLPRFKNRRKRRSGANTSRA